MEEMIDIPQIAKELKAFVSRYESTLFLGELSSMMDWIDPEHPPSYMQGISSPQKQFFYLAALNITSAVKNEGELEGQFSDNDWEKIKELLQIIDQGYQQLFDPKSGEVATDELKEKRRIAFPAFVNYYHQGLLNYDEQIIDRVESYFTKFDEPITEHFGITVSEFIEIYNWVDALPNKFFMDKINRKEGEPTDKQLMEEMMAKKLMPWEWQDHLPERQKNFFEYMSDKGVKFRFTSQQMVEKFGEQKTDLFLKLFTCQRKEEDYLFFTETNPLFFTPIFKTSDNSYQPFELKHLILAIYNTLTSYCLTNPKIKDKFIKHRGNALEDKVEKLMIDFLGQDGFTYKNYFTDEPGEQDLLIIRKNAAFIIETKADKLVEPRREPDRAYPILLQNFKSTIQKGYDQSYRVKSKFLRNEPLRIYRDEGKRDKIAELRTRNFHSTFSIVVTLERFAYIQMDLTGALEVYEDDDFPWSVCIDDLEMFLLVMKKEGKKLSDLIQFLKIRSEIQGRVFCMDETDIFGYFLNNLFTAEDRNGDDVIKLPPGSSEIFDNYYQYKGMGFAKEKNLEIKTSGKYIPMGSMRIIDSP